MIKTQGILMDVLPIVLYRMAIDANRMVVEDQRAHYVEMVRKMGQRSVMITM